MQRCQLLLKKLAKGFIAFFTATGIHGMAVKGLLTRGKKAKWGSLKLSNGFFINKRQPIMNLKAKHDCSGPAQEQYKFEDHKALLYKTYPVSKRKFYIAIIVHMVIIFGNMFCPGCYLPEHGVAHFNV